MFLRVDDGAFFLGVGTPEDKDQALFLIGEGFNDSVGKALPALILVGAGLVGADGKSSV